ncbi:MAG TPA: recombination protein NinG [Ohtaekwangia sp.]
MIRTKSKPDSLSTLIKKLDTVFSEFIRLRDCDDKGTVTCFVTGERVWWRDSDAAHYIHRAAMTTRYDQMNVHATTKDTNQFEDPFQHEKKYREKMVSTYGLSTVTQLEQRGRELQKFMRHEILELIETYSEKVKQLKKQKGL